MHKTLLRTALFVTLAVASYGQANQVRPVRAELPWYPPLARQARLSGTVDITVVVRGGQVVEAKLKSGSFYNYTPPNEKTIELLSAPAIQNVKTWEFFTPSSEARFVVTYIYKIEGEETATAQNPKVEFDFPKVTVTARPLQPQPNSSE